MNIHADKIEGDPPHGLCVSDVRLILARVPANWTEGLTEVRLANGQHHRPYAFFNHYDGILTIYSRGSTKREALAAVLSALAAPSLNIKITISRSPSDADRHRLGKFIRPLVEDLLPQMTPRKKQSPEAHIPWQPVPFPNDAV